MFSLSSKAYPCNIPTDQHIDKYTASPRPQEVAEYFNNIHVGIKGVAPGLNTVQHLQHNLMRCKLWGGLALGALAVAAQVRCYTCLVPVAYFLLPLR